MGAESLNWTPIGSTQPARIEAAPLLKRLQLERAIWLEFVDNKTGAGEPAGLAATALVIGAALFGTLVQIGLICAIARHAGG